MRTLRYGVVGANSTGISFEHMRVILRLPDVELVAVCNHDPDELARVEQIVPERIRYYHDYKTMYAEEALDAVIIATPNFTHESIAVDAFDAGLHVLCEKPLGRTLAECDNIIAAADAGGRILQVGVHRRYNNLFRHLRSIIDTGQLGRPWLMWTQVFRGDWRERFYEDPNEGRINWRHSQLLSGGSLLEKNCHDFDTFNMVANSSPLRVMASGGIACYEGRDTLDHALVIVEYANGFKANLQFSLFVPHQGIGGRHVGIVGSEGIVKIYERTQELYQYFRHSPEEVHYVDQTPMVDHGEGVYLEHVDFASCIRERKQPEADGVGARLAVAVALAAEESIRTGQAVTLSRSASLDCGPSQDSRPQ